MSKVAHIELSSVLGKGSSFSFLMDYNYQCGFLDAVKENGNVGQGEVFQRRLQP